MKKITLLMILFALILFPIHAFATQVTISKSYGSGVNYNYNSNDKTAWAGWLNANFTDPNFYSAAYCVDITIGLSADTTYTVSDFESVSTYSDGYFTAGNGLKAAWLMDEYSSWLGYNSYNSGEQCASEAGLQLAIWETLYGNTFATAVGSYTSVIEFDYYTEYLLALSTADFTDFTGANFKVAVLEDGQDLIVYKPVPEPATMLLFGLGLLGLAGAGRKRGFKA